MSAGRDGMSIQGERPAAAVAGPRRPKVIIIGPTPPPYHGMTTVTRTLLESDVLQRSYEVLHLDTADRRSQENMGRFDWTNAALALRHAGRLAGLVLRHRPDAVYVQVSQNAWAYLRDALFIIIAKVLGARVLTHLNGGGFRDFYEAANPPTRWLIRWTSGLLDGAAVLGRGLRWIYGGLVPEDRIFVLPNGIPDPMSEGPAGGETAGVTVTYLGTLIRSKGFPLLIRAAERLRSEGLSVRLVCAGSWYLDEDRVEAESLVSDLGLTDAVEFPGVVTGTAKERLLRETDIFGFPTSYPPEGQPFVILEAMAAGLPIVTTGRGAIPDMVETEVNGIVVPEGDLDALSGALRRLVEDPELRSRMARASRRRYEEQFTDEHCARRLVELLDTVRVA